VCKNATWEEGRLVSRFFSQLRNGRYAVNNGWIMNGNPMLNFAESYEFHYLRRTVIIWGDLIKLRYGKTKRDSPLLWKRMKQYVVLNASIFNGLRLDNAHATELAVGEYMVRKARKVNKNLLVFAELFTGSGDVDALYVKKLGIDALLREVIH
jgi:glycogen debranching enzyme